MLQQDVQKDFYDLLFKNLEIATSHPPYTQELKELYCIENGDLELFKKTIPVHYNDLYHVSLANNSLRHIKNMGIIVVTLACRAAIKGGIDPEISFSLSDTYINKIESLNDYKSVESLMRQSQFEYAKLVHDIKNTNGQNYATTSNPYIEQCKNYIFSHLYDKIRISEIATELSLSSNYLSVLFRRYEDISIKEFIINEKIKIVKKLLIHSKYSYIQIATSLNFSSQSHLEKQFKKLTKMTLKQYREKYYIKNSH